MPGGTLSPLMECDIFFTLSLDPPPPMICWGCVNLSAVIKEVGNEPQNPLYFTAVLCFGIFFTLLLMKWRNSSIQFRAQRLSDGGIRAQQAHEGS